MYFDRLNGLIQHYLSSHNGAGGAFDREEGWSSSSVPCCPPLGPSLALTVCQMVASWRRLIGDAVNINGLFVGTFSSRPGDQQMYF